MSNRSSGLCYHQQSLLLHGCWHCFVEVVQVQSQLKRTGLYILAEGLSGLHEAELVAPQHVVSEGGCMGLQGVKAYILSGRYRPCRLIDKAVDCQELDNVADSEGP